MRATRIVVVVALALGLLAVAPPSRAAPRWARVGLATIHPGVQMVTGDAQCTANFVFTRGTEVLLGYAAHCASTGDASATDGCRTRSLPLGTRVTIQGASRRGVLVYSSWVAMQRSRERRAHICENNDFALVRINQADIRRVNPSVPYWGGPVGLSSAPLPEGSDLYTYGNSSLRAGLTELSPKRGLSLGTDSRGWSHAAYTVTPGIPGDSGSALLDERGRASGVLSTLGLAPLPASNHFGDLARALAYAARRGFSATLVRGTQRFDGNQIPLDV